MAPFCPDCHLEFEPEFDSPDCPYCGSYASGWEHLFGDNWDFAGWVQEDTGVRIFLRETVDIQRVLL